MSAKVVYQDGSPMVEIQEGDLAAVMSLPDALAIAVDLEQDTHDPAASRALASDIRIAIAQAGAGEP